VKTSENVVRAKRQKRHVKQQGAYILALCSRVNSTRFASEK